MEQKEQETSASGETMPALDRIARRIVQLEAEIADRQTQIDDLKSGIIEAYPAGSYPAGDLTIQVRAGARRLDARALEKQFPAADYPQLYRQSLDTKAVRAGFAPTALERYTTAGKPTVTIK